MPQSSSQTVALLCLVWGLAVLLLVEVAHPQPAWQRCVIDDSLQGADGVRLADANGDGRADIVTGWEESGQTRAYFHPGRERVMSPWPRVDVGRSPSIEDAVWVDLNGDGQLDILSSCEGREKSLYAHLAGSRESLLDPHAWSTRLIEASQGSTRWMFAIPFPTHATAGERPTIVVGSKAPNGLVGLMQYSVAEDQWRIRKLADAQWIMSLQLLDIDADDDLDILYTDRKGKDSGVFWLENPNHPSATHSPASSLNGWTKHAIGAAGEEVMFIAPTNRAPAADSKPAESFEILVAVKPHAIFQLTCGPNPREVWRQQIIEVHPPSAVGTAKGVAFGDLDADGLDELVFSCEGAHDTKSGVVYLKRAQADLPWELHDVSGPDGIKFDLVELVDLDFDGDLDILTCEERHAGRGLGVIWYVNPLH